MLFRLPIDTNNMLNFESDFQQETFFRLQFPFSRFMAENLFYSNELESTIQSQDQTWITSSHMNWENLFTKRFLSVYLCFASFSVVFVCFIFSCHICETSTSNVLKTPMLLLSSFSDIYSNVVVLVVIVDMSQTYLSSIHRFKVLFFYFQNI